MATFGEFPGVRVNTERGGVQSVSVGTEEKVILFGEAAYAADGSVDGQASAGELVSLNATAEAETYFGDSQLTDGILDALQNGASLSFLRAVAPPRVDTTAEDVTTQSGTVENVPLVEDLSLIDVTDVDGGGTTVRTMDVEFRYETPPSTPTESDTLYLNPLTGEFAADSAPDDSFEFDYSSLDYQSLFTETVVRNYVNENETGVLFALSDADVVSSQLNTLVTTLRDNYKLVTGFALAEPNASTVLDETETNDVNGGAEPVYETGTYETSANQSVSSNAFFKPAPARVETDPRRTIGGGLAGLYVGKPLDDAVYNEVVQGYTGLQQQLNRAEAGDLRDQDLIPVRSGGSVRVKGNRATDFSESDTTAADFFTRRVTDRVILIVKQVGDSILGQINNPDTRTTAQDVISRELGSLAQDGLIRGNEQEQNFNVEVFRDSTNNEAVVVDVQFTPFGIVKQVDATVTLDV